jgi:RNA polymerase sigma-70 factor (ECF subfamily)
MDLVEARVDLNADVLAALLGRGGEQRSRAFEALLGRGRSDALAVALGLLRDRHDAEEAVQEASARAWKALDTLREPARFKAWFCCILVRVCRDRVRFKVRDRRALAALPPPRELREEGESPVLRAAMELPDEYREPLVLFYVQELSVADLAETLGISESNAKVRLHRARRLLRERLSGGVR